MPELTGISDEHLSSFSPKDAKFDIHKSLGDQMAHLYSLDSSDGVKGFMSGEKFVSAKTLPRPPAWAQPNDGGRVSIKAAADRALPGRQRRPLGGEAARGRL